MKARIHRGAAEIGGSCVELESRGARLLIDLGLPLDADFADPPERPTVAGLDGGDPSLLGLVLSHSHPDHYGLAVGINDVPIYLGEAAHRILGAATFFSPGGAEFQATAFLRDREPI